MSGSQWRLVRELYSGDGPGLLSGETVSTPGLLCDLEEVTSFL